ncbi:hypothetical protein ACIPPQ_18975 [Sphingopyxis sp. LARHCG72]
MARSDERRPVQRDLDILPRLLVSSVDLLQTARDVAVARGNERLAVRIGLSKLQLLEIASLAQILGGERAVELWPGLPDPANDWMPPEVDQICFARAMFPAVKHAAILVLYRLLAEPGLYISAEALAGAARVKSLNFRRILNVYVCQLRKSLAEHGLADAIVTGKQSYALRADRALALRLLLSPR